MLVRAARRSARLPPHKTYSAHIEQLHLPWLFPSYIRPSRCCKRELAIDAGSSDSALRKRRNSMDGVRDQAARRSLATHVDMNFQPSLDHSYSAFDTIPFVHSAGPINNDDAGSFEHKPWSALIMGDTLAQPPARYRQSGAVSGEAREILAVLEACLQVGRIERAAVIIKRLASLQALDSTEFLAVHNEFLKASLNRVVAHSSQNAAQAMHKWFELEIKDTGVDFNVETLAYLLKASLQSPPGSRRERLIRRYMSMAPGEMGLEILGDAMFTAEDLHDITAVTQTYNYGSANTEAAIQESTKTAQESKAAIIESIRPTPEVLATDQKGLGLKSLKQALSLLIEKDPSFDPDTLDLEARKARQIRIEEDAVTAAIDRWREESAQLIKMGFDTSLQTKSLGSRMWKWHSELTVALREELIKIEEAEHNKTRTLLEIERCTYGPFLRYLPVDKLAAATILTCMSQLSAKGIEKGLPLSAIILKLANSIEDESITEKVSKDQGKLAWGKISPADKSAFLARQSRHLGGSGISRVLAKDLSQATDVDASRWDPQWSATIKAKIGAFLLESLINTAKVPVTREHPTTGELMTQLQPAFTHGYQYKMGKKQGVIQVNSTLVTQMKREPVHSLLAKHLPMVAEPEPWSKFNQGGFILHPAKMVRIKLGDKDQRHYTEAAISNGDMETMFKGLDVLGRTSWRINQPVFDVMLEAWNKGDGIANFPAVNPKLVIPPEPESSQDPTERRKWLRSAKRVENLRGSMHSQRCFQNFQLEIARALQREKFYFPHNLDFRGRAYPIPPYLNHMGADHCRGLLKFGEGKELGPSGLKWLKVQLANVYGFDKASLSEREAFAVEHLDDIHDSVANPLNGRRWWLKAQDPWQCLAACHELKGALDLEDPTKFVSHLPVHQDGTCNGLQHYAALGGDEWGARQVNLEPGDRPADVYTAVANLVKESVSEDKAKGNPLATYLDGKITRKTVKQTVMTNVYGVTFVGARAQVKKQLLAAYSDLPQQANYNVDSLASYIATKIFRALSTMFKGAHDIQYWLGECADRISMALTPEQLNFIQANIDRFGNASDKEVSISSDGKYLKALNISDYVQFKSSVVWTNPIRMPIVQPYRTSKARVIHTNLQRISISEPHRSDPVSKRKQLQGFPPNFIHSLDATHMILSALECDKKGLSFAAVHDSFWTHAGDVGAMNNVLRDAFIRIHSDDVIGRLAAEFETRYRNGLYLAKIKHNSKFAAALRTWRSNNKKARGPVTDAGDLMTFKKIRLQEILDERKRMSLLASPNPKDVEKGKAMTTPASILESMGSEAKESLIVPDEVEKMGIGNMSHEEIHAATSDESHMDEAVFDNVDETSDDIESESAAPDYLVDTDDKAETEFKVLKDSFSKNLMKRKSRQTDHSVWAWLPLTFPEVPKKGSFDVKRLKDSQYFFS